MNQSELPQIDNPVHDVVIAIIDMPDQNQASQPPNLQQIQMFEHVQNQTQINQAVQQSLNLYQNQNFSRKNGLRKRHYRQVKRMKVGKTNQKCTICIQPFSKDQIINLLPCGHIIHLPCCKQWTAFDHKCPVCRFNLTQHFQNLELVLMQHDNHQSQQQPQFVQP